LETKDSAQWTGEEVAKLLTESPWAKKISVSWAKMAAAAARRWNGRAGGGGAAVEDRLPGWRSGGIPGAVVVIPPAEEDVARLSGQRRVR